MASNVIGSQQAIRFGDDFELDVRIPRLRKGTRVLKLERIPLEILVLLVESPGQVVSREEIVAKVWGKDVFLDTDNSIRGAVRKIRLALKDDPERPQFIQTITGRGYRFIAPVIRPQEGQPAVVLTDEERKEHGPEIPARAPDERKPRIPHAGRWLLGGAAVLALLAVAYVVTSRHAPSAAPKIKSLAVLPMKNLSGDSSQEYIADGITEELIGRLAAIHDLRVISRTSVMRFKETQPSIPEIAKALGVDAIVEGSVVREGNRIRVH